MSSCTVKVVIAPHSHNMGVRRVYHADEPAKPHYYLPNEARISAICLALGRAARQVARREVDCGTEGGFEVKVEIEEKAEA